jgi:hypothetical protein
MKLKNKQSSQGMRMKKRILYCGLVFFILLMSYPKLAGVHPVKENLVKPLFSQKIAKCLADQMIQAGDDETLNVIVATRSDVDFNLIRSLEVETGKLDIRKIYRTLSSFKARATPKQIESLAADGRVKAIEWGDLKGELYLGEAQAASNTDDLRSPTGYNVTGDGITVAVVDSGVWTGHNDLDDGQLIAFKDIWGEANSDSHTDLNSPIDGIDNYGHGTAMAGIIAGSGDGDSSLIGLAPNAKLVGVRISNDSGSMTYSVCYDALDWVGDNAATWGIDIVSCSWGFKRPANWEIGADQDTLAQLAETLVTQKGLVVVAAVGNAAQVKSVATPASGRWVLSVGGVKDPYEGGWSLYSASVSGPANYTDEPEGWYKPDVLAPAVSINCTSISAADGYAEMTGTSPAAAFVSGLTALYLEYDDELGDTVYGYNPAVKHLMMASAIDVPGDSTNGIDNRYGAGRVDGLAGLDFYTKDISSDKNDAHSFTASYTRNNEPMWVGDLDSRKDWYMYPATSDFDITITISCDYDLMVKVILYRGSTSVEDDESTSRGDGCYISHTGYAGADYYIEVRLVPGDYYPKGYTGDYYDIQIDLTSY